MRHSSPCCPSRCKCFNCFGWCADVGGSVCGWWGGAPTRCGRRPRTLTTRIRRHRKSAVPLSSSRAPHVGPRRVAKLRPISRSPPSPGAMASTSRASGHTTKQPWADVTSHRKEPPMWPRRPSAHSPPSSSMHCAFHHRLHRKLARLLPPDRKSVV